jgi:hypothetical protein
MKKLAMKRPDAWLNRRNRASNLLLVPPDSQAAAQQLVHLNGCNVFCLRAFLALAHRHHHFLAFAQGFATGRVDSAEMNENILTAITFDETKTLFIVEPFNGAFYLL